MSPAEGRLEIGEYRLAYLEWDAQWDAVEPAGGSDLFLLHGLGSNAAIWVRTVAALRELGCGCRVVALEQLGHGHSDRPSPDAPANDFVADAAAAIQRLQLRRPVVAGHSWGGAVALALAAGRPDLVAGLGLIDAPSLPIPRRLAWEEFAAITQPPLPVFASREEAIAGDRREVGEAAWGSDLEPWVERSLLPAPEGGLTYRLTWELRARILRDLYEQPADRLWPRTAGPGLLGLAYGADPAWNAWKDQAAEAVPRLQPRVVVARYDSPHDVPVFRPAELAWDLACLRLRASSDEVVRRVSALGGDWTAPSPAPGWSARELLAHLSSTHSALAEIAGKASTEASAGAGVGFDPDRWNAAQVRRRAERAPDQLVAEVVSAGAELERSLGAVPRGAVATIGPQAGLPLVKALGRMLNHQLGHVAELEACL